MDNVSVSKGVFAYKGSYKIGQKKKDFELPEYLNEPWYISYNEIWTTIEQAVKDMRFNIIQQVITDLQIFVSKVKDRLVDSSNNEIATAILLTGINVPDHTVLFQNIVSKLCSVTPYMVQIWSRDANNAKAIVEETVYRLVNNIERDDTPEVKKSQCTMRALKTWYKEYCGPSDPLVIIIPDFESFSASVLHDFILILSSYANEMKFVLIFGVATSLHAVHRSLSYDVTSKLIVKVFHTQTQIKTLSSVLEETILSVDVPFKLTGRAFQLLTDIFLFYDFSVDSFLQSYKICMILHFYGNNVNSLCCRRQDVKERVSDLTKNDIAEIKKLPSIVKYMNKYQKCTSKSRELNDEEFKNLLEELLYKFHAYMYRFLTVLRCLHCLCATLPNSPMGKQLREVYTKAVYGNNVTETQQYKECMQLLGFLSKEELVSKLEYMLKLLKNSEDPIIKEFKADLRSHVNTIQEASLDVVASTSEIVTADEKLSRSQLKEKLLKMSQKQSRSPYKQALIDLIGYLDQKVFSVHLTNPSQVPANEIFCYSDGNSAKHHIRGSLRAAVHTGLSDPQAYLNCDCCKLENDDAIPAALPDLSIIYKLHLESRKLINMYDWLQAFQTIVNPNDESCAEEKLDPKIQARFTQAVAELQFLGFIKSSRKKRDHVKRLT